MTTLDFDAFLAEEKQTAPQERPAVTPLNTSLEEMQSAVFRKLSSPRIKSVLRSLRTRLHRLVHLSSEDYDPDEGELVDLQHANVVTSRALSDDETPWHLPVLDLDVPVFALPSSTPGHSHLYIDHPLLWEEYLDLLECLTRVGLLEEGYLAASKRRKRTDIRLPWVEKGQPE